jgi:hypothetical protein
VDGKYVVAIQSDKETVTVMTETGQVYCLVGRVHFGTASLKAGQCYKGGIVWLFSVKDFIEKFPNKYNSDVRVLERVELEIKRERDSTKRSQ